MNKTINIVFVVLGVLFLVLLLVGAGFYLLVNLNNPAANYSKAPVGVTTNDNTSASSTGAVDGTGFTMTEAQKQALSSFGIDPASIPATISAEQEACFVAELGSGRVAEIKAGDTPSGMDFFKAKACI